MECFVHYLMNSNCACVRSTTLDNFVLDQTSLDKNRALDFTQQGGQTLSTFHSTFTRNAKARPGADCGSDHNPVAINIKTTLKRMKKNKCTRRKWNFSKLNSGTIKEEYRIESERLIDTKEYGENIEEACKKLKECPIKTADTVCGKRMYTKKKLYY